MNKITFSEIESNPVPIKDLEKYLKRLNKGFKKSYINNKNNILFVKIPKKCIKKDE